ncbi:hypothetical protein [Planomonospora algeriensis]
MLTNSSDASTATERDPEVKAALERLLYARDLFDAIQRKPHLVGTPTRRRIAEDADNARFCLAAALHQRPGRPELDDYAAADALTAARLAQRSAPRTVPAPPVDPTPPARDHVLIIHGTALTGPEVLGPVTAGELEDLEADATRFGATRVQRARLVSADDYRERPF